MHTAIKGSDQTAGMRRLILGFAGRTYHIVGNLMSRLIICIFRWLKILQSNSQILSCDGVKEAQFNTLYYLANRGLATETIQTSDSSSN